MHLKLLKNTYYWVTYYSSETEIESMIVFIRSIENNHYEVAIMGWDIFEYWTDESFIDFTEIQNPFPQYILTHR